MTTTLQKKDWQLTQHRRLCEDSSDVILFLAEVVGGDPNSEDFCLNMSERAGLSYILRHIGNRLLYAVDDEFQTYTGTEPLEYEEQGASHD